MTCRSCIQLLNSNGRCKYSKINWALCWSNKQKHKQKLFLIFTFVHKNVEHGVMEETIELFKTDLREKRLRRVSNKYFFLASFPHWCWVRLFCWCSPLPVVNGTFKPRAFRFSVFPYSVQPPLPRTTTESISPWIMMPGSYLNFWWRVHATWGTFLAFQL